MFTSSSVGQSSKLFSPARTTSRSAHTPIPKSTRPSLVPSSSSTISSSSSSASSTFAASSASSSSSLLSPTSRALSKGQTDQFGDSWSRASQSSGLGGASLDLTSDSSAARSLLLSPIKRPTSSATAPKTGPNRHAVSPFSTGDRSGKTPSKLFSSEASGIGGGEEESRPARRYREVLHETARHSVERLSELNAEVAEALRQQDDLSLCSGGIEESLGLVWVSIGSMLYVWRADMPDGHLVRMDLPPSQYPGGSAASGLIALFAFPGAAGAATSTAEWWVGLSAVIASLEGTIFYTYTTARSAPPARLEASLASQLPRGVILSQHALVADTNSAIVLLSTSIGSLYACHVNVHPSTQIPSLQLQLIRPHPSAPVLSLSSSSSTTTARRSQQQQQQQQPRQQQPERQARASSFWSFWSRPAGDDGGNGNEGTATDDRDNDDDEANLGGLVEDGVRQSSGTSNIRHILAKKSGSTFIIRDGYLEHINVRKGLQIEHRWSLVPVLQQKLNTTSTISPLATQLAFGDKRLAILTASYGASRPDVEYHVFFITLANLLAATESSELVIDEEYTTLPFRPSYSQAQEGSLLWSVSLVVPSVGSSAFVCSPSLVVFLQLPSDRRDIDSLELRHSEERLLATGTLLNLPNSMIGLSLRHGVLVLSQPEAIAISSSSSGGGEVGASSRSSLEADFLQFCNTVRSSQVPLSVGRSTAARGSPAFSAAEENEILELSAKILNAPANFNPRWAEAQDNDQKRQAIHPQTSLFLSERIEWKKKQHRRFLTYLETLGHWPRMSSAARYQFINHSSMLDAALALRKLQNELETAKKSELLVKALEHTVTRRSGTAVQGIAAQDKFYERITDVHDIIDVLVKAVLAKGSMPLASQVVARMVGTSAAHYRSLVRNGVISGTGPELTTTTNAGLRLNLVSEEALQKHAFWWTVSIRRLMCRLLSVQSAEFKNIASYIFDASVLLIGLCKTDSDLQLKVIKEYEAERELIIAILLKPRTSDDSSRQKRLDVARWLAETYQDFGALLHICHESTSEPSDSKRQLLGYINRFGETTNFVEFACQWYEKTGKLYELLNLPAIAADQTERPGLERDLCNRLSKFLEMHPRLSWIHDFAEKRFVDAANTLFAAATTEKMSFARRRTLVSLSKLSAYAAKGESSTRCLDSAYWDSLRAQCYLLDMQTQIANRLGEIDPDGKEELSTTVYSLEELIRFHLAATLKASNLSDDKILNFATAFDIVLNCHVLVETEEKQTILLHIFETALEASAWEEMAMATLSEGDLHRQVEETPLYKLACEAIQQQRNHPHALLSLHSMLSSMLPQIIRSYIKRFDSEVDHRVSQLFSSTLEIIKKRCQEEEQQQEEEENVFQESVHQDNDDDYQLFDDE